MNESKSAQRTVLLFFILLFAAEIAVHGLVFNLPALGQQTWRQLVGYMAARNYFLEDMSFFQPRSDIRLFPGDTGGAYHELPLVYWLSALAYKAFGIQYWIPRGISFLFNFTLLPGIFLLFRELGFQRRTSSIATFLAAFSPWYLYYSVSTEPNVLGMSFFVLGLGLLLRAFRTESYGPAYIFGSLILVLGTHAKITYLLYGLPIALLLFISQKKRSYLALAKFAILPIILIAATHAYTIHNADLLHQKAPFQRAVHIPFGVAEPVSGFAQAWRNIQIAGSNWLFEIYVGFAAIPFFLLGVWQFLKRREESFTRHQLLFFGAWLLMFFVFCGLFLIRLGDHDYYMSSIFPFVLISSATGAVFMLKRPKLRKFAIVLLALYPVASFMRIKGRWFDKIEVPPEMLYHGKEISAGIPKDDLVLVSGDKSPVVFLYYMERKGVSAWTYGGVAANQYRQNFRWLVHDRSRGELRKDIGEYYTVTPAYSKYQFDVYRLTSKEGPSVSAPTASKH